MIRAARKLYSQQQYLKTPAEMAELFADLPEALENSVEIAQRCNLSLELGKNYLPAFPVPEGHTVESFLKAEAERGLSRVWKALAKAGAKREAWSAIQERLDLELGVIGGMGFPGYFLIVADFIVGRGITACPWARAAVPAQAPWWRGLSASPTSIPSARSAVRALPQSGTRLYAGLRRGLLHGRSRPGDRLRLGTLRTYPGLPDHHLRQHGGACRSARRGSRAGTPYGYVDKIAKLIPMELEITLDKALADVGELAHPSARGWAAVT